MMEYWSSGIVEQGKDFCITYHMGVISPAVDTIFPLMAMILPPNNNDTTNPTPRPLKSPTHAPGGAMPTSW